MLLPLPLGVVALVVVEVVVPGGVTTVAGVFPWEDGVGGMAVVSGIRGVVGGTWGGMLRLAAALLLLLLLLLLLGSAKASVTAMAIKTVAATKKSRLAVKHSFSHVGDR